MTFYPAKGSKSIESTIIIYTYSLTESAAHRQTKMEKVKSQIYVWHILVDATWEGLTFSKIVNFCVALKS